MSGAVSEDEWRATLEVVIPAAPARVEERHPIFGRLLQDFGYGKGLTINPKP
jgi:hypothetical protein